MPTWGGILAQLKGEQGKHHPGGASHFDVVRRRHLTRLQGFTKRNVILYATAWTQPGTDPQLTTVSMEDLQGLMEVVHGLKGEEGLDLVLHSPGGSAEAAEAIVSYLRSKFSDIRVIVPHAAMSAASMIACASNRLVLGKHSFLGPIDPQFILSGDVYVRVAPAHAILEQFRMAQEECAKDPTRLATWLPILRQCGPSLLVQCQLHTALARTLVANWLEKYMFAADKDGASKAASIATWLSDHNEFKTHSRFIARDELRARGLLIDDLEADQDVQDAALSVYHATTHTFTGTGTAVQKIIENHLGKAFVKAQAQIQIQMPIAPMVPGLPGPAPQPIPQGPK